MGHRGQRVVRPPHPSVVRHACLADDASGQVGLRQERARSASHPEADEVAGVSAGRLSAVPSFEEPFRLLIPAELLEARPEGMRLDGPASGARSSGIAAGSGAGDGAALQAKVTRP
jgi:hypothetical protein